ncbi:glycogen debranching enzyme, partial [bacterium]|nr:glycogen debranching enzyme [bacterium]
MLSDIHPGSSHPLGASVQAGGVNFAIYSRHAQCLELLLFEGPEDSAPARVIRLDPRRHRTADYWHVLVKGIGAGQVYGWRAHGG